MKVIQGLLFLQIVIDFFFLTFDFPYVLIKGYLFRENLEGYKLY